MNIADYSRKIAERMWNLPDKGELVRIARKKIMVSVSSRLGYVPYLANPIQKNQFILDPNTTDGWARWCLENRQNAIDGFSFDRKSAEALLENGLMGGEEEIAAYEQGEAPWCITYTFLPDELKALLEGCGVKEVSLAGPGAYARTIPNELLVKIMRDEKQREDFLEFCHDYDSNPFVCGMGKDNLFAKGNIE